MSNTFKLLKENNSKIQIWFQAILSLWNKLFSVQTCFSHALYQQGKQTKKKTWLPGSIIDNTGEAKGFQKDDKDFCIPELLNEDNLDK